jgi:hypothetical protein
MAMAYRLPMVYEEPFDPKFDFRTELPPQTDPDGHSRTLRRYHKLLWNKPLPNRELFDLDINGDLPYLRLRTARVECNLTSDSICQTWSGIRWRRKWARWDDVIPSIPDEEIAQFLTTAHRIGGKLLFPSSRREGKNSINQERGINSRICDRFDLTLECIRLHYCDAIDPEINPLAATLARFGDFFDLFKDFSRYVEFFLLQDLVSEDCSRVQRLMRFDGFGVSSPLPQNIEEYLEYRQNAMRFVEARNRRMKRYIEDAEA